MKKRLLSLLLSVALLCGALPTAFAGYENFTPKTTYTDGKRGARVIEMTEGRRGFRTWIRMSDGTVKNEVLWPEDFKN